jgi:hypothetical protein
MPSAPIAVDNDEGRVLAGRPFTESEVLHFVRAEPMQAAGAALLASAWHHRATTVRPIR